uniref:Uncharacterized protein n=1 Tax=Lotus japonicus TaxID=34305 RepID=I3SQE2_LOTJA|nr:unknown [Lotus japonicus]
MSAHLLPSAQPMKMSSTMKRVVVSVKYSCSPAVYHEGVFRIPIFVRNSGMKMPAAPNIAHLQWTSSAWTSHLRLSGSDERPRGSNPKSPGRLPSSHGGGVLPGNHRGLSGSATAHTVVVDLAPTGAVKVFTFSFLPLRKAFVVPKGDPFFWELGVEIARVAMAEEAHAEAMKGLHLERQ